MTFYIFHRHRFCLVDCVNLMQLVQMVGRFWVFLLSHTAPGFQLWFYLHLYMWVVHWGLAPEAGKLGFGPMRVKCGGGAADGVWVPWWC